MSIKHLPQHEINPFTKDSEGWFSHSEKIASLDKCAHKLYWLVSKMLNSEMVRIDFDLYSRETGVNSKASYYKAIVELVDCGVIAIASTPLFFVNRKFFPNATSE